MINNGRNGERKNRELPALSGILSPEYETRDTGGGSGPREFATAHRVRQIFRQGVARLGQSLNETADEYNIQATIGRIRLRSDALVKSHRHSFLFDKVQIAGVQEAGNILALVTRNSLDQIADLLEHATETNLKRISAVAEITPYDAPIERRGDRFVVSLFDGSLDDGSNLRDQGVQILEQIGIDLGPYGGTLDHFIASTIPPDGTFETMPWIRRIRPVFKATRTTLPTTLSRPRRYFSTPSFALPTPIIGLVDSGIDPSIESIERLVVHRESHVPPEFADVTHGTVVGAVAATGDGFDGDPELAAPRARLLDIQLIGTGASKDIDEDDLLIQVEHAVKRFGPKAVNLPDGIDQPVIVWNLSMNLKTIASTDEFSSFGMELDRIMHENDVIFTVPTGNYMRRPFRSWTSDNGPDVVADGKDRISPPADAALALTVGSLSDSSREPSIADAGHPSPFSRRGPGPGHLVKPDFVQFGGTCGESGEAIGGVRGPQVNGTSEPKIGTSVASPRIASQLAELVEVLPQPKPEILKLMALLSSTSPGDHDNSKRSSINYYGFGLPDSPVSILACEPWECTILLEGVLRPGHLLKIPFPFPPSLTDPDTRMRRGWIRMGLVYTPELDPTKGFEYCQTDVEASLGREFHNPRGYRREVYPVPSEYGNDLRNEQELITKTLKWSPIKLYERTISQMPFDRREVDWRLTLKLLLRREMEIRRQYIRQRFWLGIRIADPERRSPIYQEMRQQIGNLVQPMVLRSQISIFGNS